MFPMSANGSLLFSAGPLLFFLRNSLEGDLDPAKKDWRIISRDVSAGATAATEVASKFWGRPRKNYTNSNQIQLSHINKILLKYHMELWLKKYILYPINSNSRSEVILTCMQIWVYVIVGKKLNLCPTFTRSFKTRQTQSLTCS